MARDRVLGIHREQESAGPGAGAGTHPAITREARSAESLGSALSVAHGGGSVATVAAVAALAVGLGVALVDVAALAEQTQADADRDQAVGLGVGVPSRAAGTTVTTGALEGDIDVLVLLVVVATLVRRNSRAGEGQRRESGSCGDADNALNTHAESILSSCRLLAHAC